MKNLSCRKLPHVLKVAFHPLYQDRGTVRLPFAEDSVANKQIGRLWGMRNRVL